MNDVESERKKGVAWLKIQRERETSNPSSHVLVWNELSSLFWLSCAQISSLLSADVKRSSAGYQHVGWCLENSWLMVGFSGAVSEIHCWCSIDSLAAGNILSLWIIILNDMMFWHCNVGQNVGSFFYSDIAMLYYAKLSVGKCLHILIDDICLG